MDCNKDEAVRAKDIAEKKMQSNDFEGALRIILKAKNLYSELENLNQMLSICEVHCAAQKKVMGYEKDWYGVLQVEKLSDLATVKKHYRRLALNLHPDKNRFPCAEAAFKMISEAYALLSDPTKKSLYDNKIKAFNKSATANPSNVAYINRSSQVNQQYNTQNNSTHNGFSSLNQHQATQLTFWTCCPFCDINYKYSRQHINKSLHCPKCKKMFCAYEICVQGAQNVPSMPGMRQPTGFQEKVATSQANSKVPSTSQAGSRGTANKKTVQPQPGTQKETVNLNASSLRGEKFGKASNGDAIHREPKNARSKNQRKRRKIVLGSGDSSDDDLEDPTEKEKPGDDSTDLGSEFTRAQFAHRSSRRKQHVSYQENSDDDNARPHKRVQTTKVANDKEQKNVVGNEDSKHGNQSSFPTASGSVKFENNKMGAVQSEESLNDKNEGCDKEGEMGGVSGGKSKAAADAVEIESDSDLDLSSSENSNAERFDCPDAEFSDFDHLRDESHFHVNQYWACYDTLDGMPRFYAKVTKVHRSPFELRIKWLEAVPINDSFEKWVDEELPVGCGSFKLGKADKISGCFTLSHQVHLEKGKKKNHFVLYPRKGEVWALLRDWDIRWSSDLESYREFRYQIVEVLSDFAPGVGIKVGYLDKVTGFVCLFQRASPSETSSFVIVPTDLYRFSHCVPSFKMSGAEREGVPIGSFELDPASLPLDPDHLYYPSKENEDPSVSNTLPKCTEGKDKSAAAGGARTPHKNVDLEGARNEATKIRRSPRGVNVIRQNTNRVVPPTTSVHRDW